MHIHDYKLPLRSMREYIHSGAQRLANVMGYRMMALLGQGNMSSGGSQGIAAMITIAMIVLGISMGSFIDRLLHPVRPEEHGKD